MSAHRSALNRAEVCSALQAKVIAHNRRLNNRQLNDTRGLIRLITHPKALTQHLL